MLRHNNEQANKSKTNKLCVIKLKLALRLMLLKTLTILGRGTLRDRATLLPYKCNLS